MILTNGFVINAPEHLLPCYRISPFRTVDSYQNKIAKKSDGINIKQYLSDRFPEKNVLLTSNGRSALKAALIMLNLETDDVVTIFTTTNGFYISSCVTNEIEKRCKWSRDIEKNTKAILVNHEFGFCSQDMEEYAALGYPIIEDFAHSFVSDSIANNTGHYSDFLVFSFSKYFPIQIGGALAYSKSFQNNYEEEKGMSSYINNVINNHVNLIPNIKSKRIENYYHFVELFTNLNLAPYFTLEKNDCPGVFCFEVPERINLNKMKVFLNSNGVESSVLYGENAYFLPCHQNIEKSDIEYMHTLVKFFLEAEL